MHALVLRLHLAVCGELPFSLYARRRLVLLRRLHHLDRLGLQPAGHIQRWLVHKLLGSPRASNEHRAVPRPGRVQLQLAGGLAQLGIVPILHPRLHEPKRAQLPASGPAGPGRLRFPFARLHDRERDQLQLESQRVRWFVHVRNRRLRRHRHAQLCTRREHGLWKLLCVHRAWVQDALSYQLQLGCHH